MMTVVTTMKLHSGSEAEWDALIRDRFRSAHGRDGWISGQLLSPAGFPHTRVIVGTWRDKQDWQAWHEDPEFLATRAQLDRLQSNQQETAWYDVVEESRA